MWKSKWRSCFSFVGKHEPKHKIDWRIRWSMKGSVLDWSEKLTKKQRHCAQRHIDNNLLLKRKKISHCRFGVIVVSVTQKMKSICWLTDWQKKRFCDCTLDMLRTEQQKSLCVKWKSKWNQTLWVKEPCECVRLVHRRRQWANDTKIDLDNDECMWKSICVVWNDHGDNWCVSCFEHCCRRKTNAGLKEWCCLANSGAVKLPPISMHLTQQCEGVNHLQRSALEVLLTFHKQQEMWASWSMGGWQECSGLSCLQPRLAGVQSQQIF